jgi:hypothetical protein
MIAQKQMLELVQPVQDMMSRYTHTMNEVVAMNMDVAFDVLLKNYNFVCSMRNSADMMMGDMIKSQQRLITEMVHVAQDYAAKLPAIMPSVTR